MKKILFVCLGNICRSPMAEAIFNHQVKKKGLMNYFLADSAGTANYHIGEDPDPRTIETVEKHHIAINHKGQQFEKMHAKAYDYLVAMDSSNRANMKIRLGNENKHIYLLREFDPKGYGDVPDPWYGGLKGFDEVYHILDRSIKEFMEFLQKKKIGD
ncbi:MAG: low molecular weight protein-tyrosine-phosphatase [Bacteroidota bacterium]